MLLEEITASDVDSAPDVDSASIDNCDPPVHQIDRPEHGGIDIWFERNWESKTFDFIDDDALSEQFSHKFERFGNEAFKMGLEKMCGCTAIIIVSKIGAFMEKPTMKHASKNGLTFFHLDVLQELKRVLPQHGFNKEKDPGLQVALYTKCKTQPQSAIEIDYPKPITEIKTTVAKAIPGLLKQHIRVVRYYVSPTTAKVSKLSAGKLVVCYDPKAEPGKIGCDVWAGSLSDAKGKVIPPNNNNPILSCRWSQRNYGELYQKPCLGINPPHPFVPGSLPGAMEVLTSFIGAASATSVKTSKELGVGIEEESVGNDMYGVPELE